MTQLQGEDTGDFEATTAAAFLLSSESSKTIFIAVKDDDLPEADETFVFNLRLQVKFLECALLVLIRIKSFLRVDFRIIGTLREFQ